MIDGVLVPQDYLRCDRKIDRLVELTVPTSTVGTGVSLWRDLGAQVKRRGNIYLARFSLTEILFSSSRFNLQILCFLTCAKRKDSLNFGI